MKKTVYYLLIAMGAMGFVGLVLLHLCLPRQFSTSLLMIYRYGPLAEFLYYASLVLYGMACLALLFNCFRAKRFRRPSLFLSLQLLLQVSYGLIILPSMQLLFSQSTKWASLGASTYTKTLEFCSFYLLLAMAVMLTAIFCLASNDRFHVFRQHRFWMVSMFIFVVFSGGIIYHEYYDQEEVDLTKQIAYQCQGVSGNGWVEIISNTLGTEVTYTDFNDTLQYSIENNGRLSNGMEVLLQVDYDESLAQSLKLDITNPTLAITISGLTDYYSKVEDLPAALVKRANQMADEMMFDTVSEALNGQAFQIETIATYYAYEEGVSGNELHALVNLYLIEYDDSYYYRACEVTGLDSRALKDRSYLVADDGWHTYTSTLMKKEDDFDIVAAKEACLRFMGQYYDVIASLEVGAFD